MGRDLQHADVRHKARDVKAFVGAHRTVRPSARLAQQHCRLPFCAALGVGRADVGDEAMPIVQQHVPEIRQFGLAALPLPVQARVGVACTSADTPTFGSDS